MRVADLAQALPGLLVFGLLPGLLLATALVPRWPLWQRLTAAPGLSAGVAGLSGLVMHHLHLPFHATTAGGVDVVIAAIAVARVRRSGAAGPAPGAVRAAVAAALVSGLVSAAVLGVAFSTQLLPVEFDAPVHAIVADRIVSGHDTVTVVAQPADGGAWVRTRTGFEAEVALVAELGGPDPAHGMLPVVLLAVLLLPLGLTMLALGSGCSALIAGLAPLLGIALLFPAFPTVFGEFPLIVDSTLVVPLVVTALRGLRPGGGAGPALFLAVMVASIWAVHGTEVLTALLVGAPLIATVLLTERSPAVLRRGLGLAAAGLVATAVVAVLTRSPSLPPPTASPLGGPPVADTSAFGATVGRAGVADVVALVHGYLLPTAAAVGLYAAGLLAVVRGRGLRWLLAAHLLLVACLADEMAGGVLRRLWTQTFPWSTADRLLSIQYWVLPLILAAGLAWLGATAASLARGSDRRRVAAAMVAAGAAVAVVSGSVFVARQYHDQVAARTVVDGSDINVLARMSATIPPGASVVADGSDAGEWIEALTPDRLYFSKLYIQSHEADVRLSLLDGACEHPPAAADAALFPGVAAVFVGAHQAAGAPHRWSAQCLARVPWLRPLATAGDGEAQAAAFAIVR